MRSPALNRTPPTSAAERFLGNMRALWRCQPSLALQLDAIDDDDRVAIEPAKSGEWTTKLPSNVGAAVYLHSRHDPAGEADRFAASIPIEDRYCFVVCGMGLGYHVRALLNRLHKEAFVVCIEPNLPLLASALTCLDFSEAINAQRLMFVTGEDKARLHELLRPISTYMMIGAQFVQHPPSMRVAEADFRRVLAAISEFVTFSRMSLTTLVANSRTTCRNVAMNLVHYLTTPPIDALKDCFRGHPGVIIAAGPSLGRNIDQLTELKGRAVLCAVQTALKPLRQRGIVPDFVTTLDFHEVSKQFFEGVDGLDQVHLVAEPKVTWHVLDNYPGPASILGNSWAQLVLGDTLGCRAGLPAGATVAHLAFYFALHLGCDPIIFVGQDLAFTGHVFYTPGVEIHRTWQSEVNRFVPMEQKEWERIVRNRPILRRVRGNQGEDLYTDELLFTYLEQFEKDIAAAPCRVINATEGGAQIRGTTVMPLSEVAGQFCRTPIDPDRFEFRRALKDRSAAKLPAAQTELEARLAEFKEAEAVCDELLRLLDELDGLTHDAERFNRRLHRVDELRTKVAQDSRAYLIVNAATQLAELRRFSADRRIEAATLDAADRAKRQITRDREFVRGVRDGIRDVRPMLEEALTRLKCYPEVR